VKLPLLLKLRIQTRDGRQIWLVLPLFLLWLLLLPFMLLLSPFIMIGFMVQGVNPYQALSTLWRLFCGLCDLEFDFQKNESNINMHIV